MCLFRIDKRRKVDKKEFLGQNAGLFFCNIKVIQKRHLPIDSKLWERFRRFKRNKRINKNDRSLFLSF